MDHFPSDDDEHSCEYTIILDQSYPHVLTVNDEISKLGNLGSGLSNPTEFATFLIDLLRLEKIGLSG
ncbi:MAG: hypothetical protein CXX80_09060, partial [Methanobacteriota archaeon]